MVSLNGTVSDIGAIGRDLTNETDSISLRNSSAVASVPEPNILALVMIRILVPY